MSRRRHDDQPWPRSFYARDAVTVARDLLGRLLIRATVDGRSAGRIVEVEAYLGLTDPASHSYRGQTPRNAVMFGPPGHTYVYAIHSRWCVNVVTEPEGVPSAVLLRAIEPSAGLELMRARRLARRRYDRTRGLRAVRDAGARRVEDADEHIADRDLARGPASLCTALAIDRGLNGWDLTRGETLWIAGAAQAEPFEVAVTPRIGVTSAQESMLRFFVAGNPCVSKPAAHRRGV